MKIHSKHKKLDATGLLKDLIGIVSYSGKEWEVADYLAGLLKEQGLNPERKKNNIWALPDNYNPDHPNILLNAHLDTVKPSGNWTTEPHRPLETNDRIYGVGANDDGASLVCLLDTFLYFSGQKLPVNIIFSATAEEETGGKNGVQLILPDLSDISLGIIGEPTGMRMAAGERGLLVIEGKATGTQSHAANENNDNAILNAFKEIQKIQAVRFEKESAFLGKVKVTLTQINAGSQHNVVPGECRFVLDIRLNDRYTPEEVLEKLQSAADCTLTPRSLERKASGIPAGHLVIKAAEHLNIPVYGSLTLSNMAYVPFHSVKIGPGESKRSHKPDEFIYKHELEQGKSIYKQLINQYIAML